MNVEKHLPLKKEALPNLVSLKFKIFPVLETIALTECQIIFHNHQAYLCQQGVSVHLQCEKDNHSYILEFTQAFFV